MTFSDPATGLLPEPAKPKRPRGAPLGNSNALKDGRYRRRRLLQKIDWQTQLDPPLARERDPRLLYRVVALRVTDITAD